MVPSTWRIYYEDGSTFSNEDGSPWDAPRDGVEVIVSEGLDKKLHVMSQADYYYYEPERSDYGWWFADFGGMFDHLRRAKAPLVLQGRMTHRSNFTEIEKRALDDVGRMKGSWRRAAAETDVGHLDGRPA